jgi:YbbR domain-containing protein
MNMLRWLTTNLRTFLLAFILALAVWVTAVTSTNPDETDTLPAPVPIEFMGQDASLVQIASLPTSVQVSLRAPRSVWEQIRADPTVVRAIVDMTGLGAGTHRLEVVVQVSVQPVRVLSVTPATVNLVLEPLASATLPVQLVVNGELAPGYQIGEIVLTPPEVDIFGPQSLVEQVASLQAEININNARASIETDLPITAVDASGNKITGLTFSPQTLKVTLPITQLGGYRDLVVKVVTVGSPASGYRLESVEAYPPIVTVYSGNTNLIESLPGYVETTPLSLSGAREDIETYLSLVLPPDVTIVGKTNILVKVGIATIEGSSTISNRPVTVSNLSPGLKVEISPATVDVILSGPLPLLDTLRASDILINIDLKGRGVGSYQLTPTVTVLVEGLRVESIVPGAVQVTITQSTP